MIRFSLTSIIDFIKWTYLYVTISIEKLQLTIGVMKYENNITL